MLCTREPNERKEGGEGEGVRDSSLAIMSSCTQTSAKEDFDRFCTRKLLVSHYLCCEELRLPSVGLGWSFTCTCTIVEAERLFRTLDHCFNYSEPSDVS